MKKILIPVMILAASASCSKKTAETPPADRVEIRVASQALSIDTKKPYDGPVAPANPFTADIWISERDGNYNILHNTGNTQITFTGTSATGFTPSVHFPSADDNDPVYLCGLYPAAGYVWTGQGTTAQAVIDGKTDLMAAQQKSTTKAQAIAGSHPQLRFGHLLTRLNIFLKGTDAALEAWGTATGIELVQAGGAALTNRCTWTCENGDVQFSAADATELPCYLTTDDTEFTGKTIAMEAAPTQAAAYVLCQPVEARTGADEYMLHVVTTGHADPIEVPLNLKAKDSHTDHTALSTAGQEFDVTLEFLTTDIQAVAEVTEWTEGGTSTGTIR